MKTKSPAVLSSVCPELTANEANPQSRAAGALRCVECYLPRKVACDHQDAIATVVAAEFKLTLDNIHTRTRAILIAWPRQIAMFLAYQHGYRSTDIARYWVCDHSTVLHACRTVRNLMDVYPDVKALIHRLAATLGIRIS